MSSKAWVPVLCVSLFIVYWYLVNMYTSLAVLGYFSYKIGSKRLLIYNKVNIVVKFFILAKTKL